MGEGFGGYKAFVIAVLAIVFVGMSAPDVRSNFDPLRTRGSRSPEVSDFAATPEEGWPRLFTGLLHRASSGGRPVVGSGPGSGSPSTQPGSGGDTGSTGSNPGASNPLYPEESAIPSNFDIQSYLQPSWGTGAIPGTMGADPVGAFRFICGAGQVRYDDPIVYPGQPGDSHLHQFYGNTGADASSTFSSLRQSGNSSCGDPLNRSAYWMPAMLDGKGHVVQPDFVSIYYKRIPASSPDCGDPRTDPAAHGICVPIPNGLRFIFGYDMLTNTAPTGDGQFMCDTGSSNHAVGVYSNLAELAKAGCPAGDKIELLMSAPMCWDGQHLDSANHRSHVSYVVTDRYTAFKHCPADHPYLMPRFQLGVFYTIAPGDNLTLWHLSSDEMVPGAAAGSTFHADYFEGWDNRVKAMWTDNCINKHLNCSGGDLGNGLQMRGAAEPSYGWTNPNRLVPVPAR